MAVYTDVTAEELADFLTPYGIGELLSYKGIAEGVEKVSQMEVLFNLGCHICQGFLFARPMPPAQVEQWLADTQSGLILPRVGNLPDGLEQGPHTAS